MIAQGLSVVFISHKLHEVLAISTASWCCATASKWGRWRRPGPTARSSPA
jgi:ABC-type sugar transport system ATPase subunit